MVIYSPGVTVQTPLQDAALPQGYVGAGDSLSQGALSPGRHCLDG